MSKYFHDQKVKNLIYLVRKLIDDLRELVEVDGFVEDHILDDNLISNVKAQIREIENERN